MLGIQSQISIQPQISKLSICSNPQPKNQYKITIMTNRNSQTLVSEVSSLNSTFGSKNEKIKKLQLKLQQAVKKHQQMQKRMKGYLLMIQKVLKIKEQQNFTLKNGISLLKKEVEDSKIDFDILVNFMNQKPVPVAKSNSKNNQINKSRSIQIVQLKKKQSGQVQKKINSSQSPVIVKNMKGNRQKSGQQSKNSMSNSFTSNGKIKSPIKNKI